MDKNYIEMDGCFEYNNEIIYYQIADNWNEKPKMVSGVEKMGRYLNFYSADKKLLKTKRVYGDFEAMQNISSTVALEYHVKEDN